MTIVHVYYIFMSIMIFLFLLRFCVLYYEKFSYKKYQNSEKYIRDKMANSIKSKSDFYLISESRYRQD